MSRERLKERVSERERGANSKSLRERERGNTGGTECVKRGREKGTQLQ